MSDKYVPPHKKGTASVSTSSGWLMPLKSAKATALRDWLNGLTTITAIHIGRHGNNLDVMQLGEKIEIDGVFRNVRYNVHAGGIVGSTWIEGVIDVSINAQDNTRSATFLTLWQNATAKPGADTTTTTSPGPI